MCKGAMPTCAVMNTVQYVDGVTPEGRPPDGALPESGQFREALKMDLDAPTATAVDRHGDTRKLIWRV